MFEIKKRTLDKTFQAVAQIDDTGVNAPFRLRLYGKLFEMLAGELFTSPNFLGYHVNRYRKDFLHHAESHNYGDDSVPDLVFVNTNLELVVGLGELKLLSPQNARTLVHSLKQNHHRTFRQITNGGFVVESDEWGKRYPLRFNPKRARYWFSQINQRQGALRQLYEPLPYYLIVPTDTCKIFENWIQFGNPILIPGVDDILSIPYTYQSIIDTIDGII